MDLTATQLTEVLGGRWTGRSGIAFCPAHDNQRTPALSISVGDNGALLLHCFSGCAFIDIMQAVKALEYRFPCKSMSQAPQRDPRHSFVGQDRRAAQARKIWQEARTISDTPAEWYLRSRGIRCALPDTLRYHPSCWHGSSACQHPAMIARVEGSSGMSIHRTFIRPDGIDKASVTPTKMMLGATAGGAVRLTGGQRDSALVIAEGIETSLSLANGLFSNAWAIWAALSASGMAKVVLPRQAGSLVVAMDGDVAGRRAGLDLAHRAYATGWEVHLLDAPDGCDWNDVLLNGELV